VDRLAKIPTIYQALFRVFCTSIQVSSLTTSKKITSAPLDFAEYSLKGL
jgi:hypothetical protein